MSVSPQVENRPIARVGNLSIAAKITGMGINKHLSNALGILILVISDITALSISLGLAYLTRLYIFPYIHPVFKPINLEALLSLWWFPLITLIILTYEGMYHQRLPIWREVKRVIKAVTWSIILAVLFMFLIKNLTSVSRTLVTLAYIYVILLLPLSRFIIKRSFYKVGLWQKPVLILGAGKTAELVIKGFQRESTMGYRPVGLLEDNSQKRGIKNGKNLIPILGGFGDVEEILNRTGVSDVVIAAPGMNNKKLVELTNRLQQISANLMLIPDLFGIPLTGIQVGHLFDEETLFLSMHNNLASKWNCITKRVFDVVTGSMIMLLILPLMLIIYLIIKKEDKGPAMYVGYRIGKDGKKFQCYKFRTMYIDNDKILQQYLQKNPQALDEWKKYAKLKNYDPRVTKVGRLLRSTSLDELPQIFNVLKGEMSLVGPRPYLPREREDMGVYAQTILKTPPGITGLWQVSGRNDIDFNGRLHIESWYVRNWSLWQDITLLIRTIGVVLRRKGAY